jgi:hypothetical protein
MTDRLNSTAGALLPGIMNPGSGAPGGWLPGNAGSESLNRTAQCQARLAYGSRTSGRSYLRLYSSWRRSHVWKALPSSRPFGVRSRIG